MLILLAGTSGAGISWPFTTPLTSAVATGIYGRGVLGTISACIFAAMNVSIGGGSYVARLDYDLAGSYHLSLLDDDFLDSAAAGVVSPRTPVSTTQPLVAPPTQRRR